MTAPPKYILRVHYDASGTKTSPFSDSSELHKKLLRLPPFVSRDVYEHEETVTDENETVIGQIYRRETDGSRHNRFLAVPNTGQSHYPRTESRNLARQRVKEYHERFVTHVAEDAAERRPSWRWGHRSWAKEATETLLSEGTVRFSDKDKTGRAVGGKMVAHAVQSAVEENTPCSAELGHDGQKWTLTLDSE